jgi:hypothetical protein
MDRLQEAGRLSVVANKIFLDEARELLVSFDREALSKAMLAWIRLNAGPEIASSEPSVELYLSVQERAFLTLFDRGAVVPIAEVTSLGEAALGAMRVRTGVGIESLPTPEPVLSETERLEREVASDWKILSSKQIKHKIANSKSYRECFERLSETNFITSSVTSRVVISET